MISSDKIIGNKILHYEHIDSTNAEAKRIIEEQKAEEGIVITADFQTQGRGQYGRVWQSERHQNIMMSVIVKPIHIKATDQFLLNIIVSLAVAEVLSQYCKGVSVKWPNDIYVHDKKIAGILIQNFLQGEALKWSIVGLGLNVHQRVWPDDVVNATSLAREGIYDASITTLKDQIYQSLDQNYQRSRLNPSSQILAYQSVLYRKCRPSFFEKDGVQFLGTILGVDPTGKLQIEIDGKSESFNHGEISFVI